MDPPPTEIYTYLPTLSLHDALPISGIKTRLLLGNLHSPAGYVPVEISAPALQASVTAIAAELPQLPVRPVCADFTRSEEHTSELQSLMRISYAVFCLKKKKNTILIHIITFSK